MTAIQTIRDTGNVFIGIAVNDVGPFECLKDGIPKGFDIEVAENVVQRLSEGLHTSDKSRTLTAKFRIYPWENIFEAVKNREVQFIISGITATPLRQERHELAFTRTYYGTHPSLFYYKTDLKAEAPSDLGEFLRGKTLIVMQGTTGQELAEWLVEGFNARISVEETWLDAFSSLNKHAPATAMVVGDASVLHAHRRILSKFKFTTKPNELIVLNENKFQELQQSRASQQGSQKKPKELSAFSRDGRRLWTDSYSIAVSAKDQDLLVRINKALEDLDDKGQLKMLEHICDPPPIPWTPGYAAAVLASYSAGES